LNNISYQLFIPQPLNLKNEIMSTKAILAGIAGGIFAFFLGWLIFGVLLMDYYTANTTHYEGLMKEMPNIVLLLVSNLVWGFWLSFIFERWAKITTIGNGIVGGIIIGLPVALAFDLWALAGMNLFNGTIVIVDVLANTLLFALMGGLIGFILGYKKKTTA
jgi:hypothetical protein